MRPVYLLAPKKKKGQKHYIGRELQIIIPSEHRCKNLLQYVNQVQEHQIKYINIISKNILWLRWIYHSNIRCVSMWKWIHIFQWISWVSKIPCCIYFKRYFKNHFNKCNSCLWLQKNLSKLGMEGNFLKLIKCIYENYTPNIISNNTMLSAFHYTLGIK